MLYASELSKRAAFECCCGEALSSQKLEETTGAYLFGGTDRTNRQGGPVVNHGPAPPLVTADAERGLPSSTTLESVPPSNSKKHGPFFNRP